MSESDTTWTDTDTIRAHQIWDDYQQENDVSPHIGRTAGVDPASGRVWFGNSAKEIALELQAQGELTPLFFFRVGSDWYARKGVRS